jgi:hypothetical protein
LEAGLLRADLVTDGRTERQTYDEANSRFFAILRTNLNVLRDMRFFRRNTVEDQVVISIYVFLCVVSVLLLGYTVCVCVCVCV